MISRLISSANRAPRPGRNAPPNPEAPIWKPMVLAAWAIPTRSGVRAAMVGKMVAKERPMNASPRKLTSVSGFHQIRPAPAMAPSMLRRSSVVLEIRSTSAPMRMRPTVKLAQ